MSEMTIVAIPPAPEGAISREVSATPFQVTQEVCACGCDTYLNSKLVNAGKRFIWGHKGGAGKIHSKQAHKQQAPRPGLAKVTGILDVLQFLKENEKLMIKQENEARFTLGEALKTVEHERTKISSLVEQRQKISAAIEQLDSVPAWRVQKELAKQQASPQAAIAAPYRPAGNAGAAR